jgi:hypothetical protein
MSGTTRTFHHHRPRRRGHRRRPFGLHRGRAAGGQGARRGADREGSAPALSHRRIAAAHEHAAVRPAGRAHRGRGHRHAQARRRVRLALARPQQPLRLRPGDGQELSVRRARAPLGVRRTAVPPRRQARRAHLRAAARHRRGHGRRQGHARQPPAAEGEGRRRHRDHLAPALRDRRQRARHAAVEPVRRQAAQPQARQRRAVRPLRQRRAPARPLRGQHFAVLVRPWLVLVHPAERRHGERGRGGVPGLLQAPQGFARRVPDGNHRARAQAGRAPEKRDADGGRNLHRQLRLRLRSSAEATAS